MPSMTVDQHIISALKEEAARSASGKYKYQIAAGVFDSNTFEILALSANGLPSVFKGIYEPSDEIGDSGATIHAEMFALAKSSSATQGKSLLVTDPLCPNCMKSVIAAGIKHIYILETGFNEGVWYNSTDEQDVPRKQYFDIVSLGFAPAAGVSVSIVSSINGDILEVLAPLREGVPDAGFDLKKVPEKPCLKDYILEKNSGYALAKVIRDNECYLLRTDEHFTAGFSEADADFVREQFGDLRYRLKIDPLSNLLSVCAKEGFEIVGGEVYVSELPTSRCIVNAIGFGTNSFLFPAVEAKSPKAKSALKALKSLCDNNLISYQTV